VGDWRCVYDPSPWYVNDHCFIRDDDGTWHLFGITHEEPFDPFDEVSLAHATAPSLLGPWKQQPFALTASAGAGETHLWAPHVVVGDDGRYWMFVCGGGESPASYRIQVAVSDDCWTWQRHPANPVVVDGYQARDPMVLRVGDRWVMYYTATRDNHVVVAVTSRDLVTWSAPVVVLRDPMVGTEAGPTESPFVVAGADGRWYLFVGPDYAGLVAEIVAAGCRTRDDVAAVLRGSAPYRTTRILVSDDPFHWEPGAVVGTIDAHAAEVVVDEHGAMWVSHCGWGQGGVWLAPLAL
jgi:beta-fructofuranosidase